MATNAELGARDTDDDLVLHDERSTGAGFAFFRIAVDDLPEFLVCLRVERDSNVEYFFCPVACYDAIV
jgi:hypothetical protein